MKRLPALAFALLVCALTLGVLARPTHAYPPICFNVCDYAEGGPMRTTSTVTGTGSSCTAADASLTSQLQQLASSNCTETYCVFTKVITQSCSQTATGQYQVRGYATHYCKHRECEDPYALSSEPEE